MGLWAPRFQAVWREITPLYRPPQFVRRRIRAPSRVSLYDLRVGSRIIRRRNDAAVHRREALTFWAILLAIGLPMILAVALVAMDMRRDLSEMRSTGLKDDRGAVPVAWPELKQGSEFSGRVRMIGYMMDEHRPVHETAPGPVGQLVLVLLDPVIVFLKHLLVEGLARQQRLVERGH